VRIFFKILSFTHIHILWDIAVAQYEERQCLKWLQLRKGCVKSFHSRKFPLDCEGTLRKGKDHCPGLPEWLHLLSLLWPPAPHTLLPGWKSWKSFTDASSLCWVRTQPTRGGLTGSHYTHLTFVVRGAQTCQATVPIAWVVYHTTQMNESVESF